MTRMVLAIVGERYEGTDGNGGGWHVRRYAFVDDLQENARLKDENYVTQLIHQLMGEGSAWVCDERPPESMKRFFDVVLEVSDHGREDAKYKVDYRKYDGCPSQAIDDGMDIYRAIKKHGVRKANKTVAARKQLKEAQEAAEKARKRFEEGKRYWTEMEDSLGHLGCEFIVFNADRMAKKVRRYENGNEYLKFKGKIFKAENQ